MRVKGINLDTPTGFSGDVLVIYKGGVFVGRTKGVNVAKALNGPEIMEFTIETFHTMALDPRQSTSDVAIGVLRKLLKKAAEHKDKESEELISGALTLLEL